MGGKGSIYFSALNFIFAKIAWYGLRKASHDVFCINIHRASHNEDCGIFDEKYFLSMSMLLNEHEDHGLA